MSLLSLRSTSCWFGDEASHNTSAKHRTADVTLRIMHTTKSPLNMHRCMASWSTSWSLGFEIRLYQRESLKMDTVFTAQLYRTAVAIRELWLNYMNFGWTKLISVFETSLVSRWNLSQWFWVTSDYAIRLHPSKQRIGTNLIEEKPPQLKSIRETFHIPSTRRIPLCVAKTYNVPLERHNDKPSTLSRELAWELSNFEVVTSATSVGLRSVFSYGDVKLRCGRRSQWRPPEFGAVSEAPGEGIREGW